MKVKVHPHRNKFMNGDQQCISVTPAGRGGRVFYCGTARMENVRFVIHQSGVTRARSESKRNVHAWAVGDLTSAEHDQRIDPAIRFGDTWQRITYAYQTARFVVKHTGEDVTDMIFPEVAFVGAMMFARRA